MPEPGALRVDPAIQPDPLCVRVYSANDEPAALALHRRGFGQMWPTARWAWRTTNTPTGEAQAVGAFGADGRCRALFVGVPIPCRYRGEPGLALSGSNSLLDADLRQTLGGARLFRQVVLTFFDRFGGGTARIMYGSPIQPLVRAMITRMRVQMLADVHALVWEPGSPPTTTELFVGDSAVVPDDADALWRRCASDQPTGLIRDRAFWVWRFQHHPDIRYRFATARAADGTLRGVMVVRDGGWSADTLSIADWLAEDADTATEAALLGHAAALARRHGQRAVVAVWSPNAPQHKRWQTHHRFYVHPTAHQIVFRSFAHDIDRQFLFDHWRLTMADLEFL